MPMSFDVGIEFASDSPSLGALVLTRATCLECSSGVNSRLAKNEREGLSRARHLINCFVNFFLKSCFLCLHGMSSKLSFLGNYLLIRAS